MKINDIVTVRDASYCMSLSNGCMRHVDGFDLKGRLFRACSVEGAYPTQESLSSGRNNTLLVDRDNSNFVLFTQERFCDVVTPVVDILPPTEVEVVVPRRAKVVHLILPS